MALGAAGLWADLRERRPIWFVGVAALSTLTIAVLFVAYWRPALLAPIGFVAPVAFVGSMCWESFQFLQDLRDLRTEQQLSRREQLAVTIVLGVLCLPAFLVAGISAFRV